jgi:hypothetical protein
MNPAALATLVFMRGNPEVFPRLRRGSPGRTSRFATGLLSFRYTVGIVAAGMNPAALATLV